MQVTMMFRSFVGLADKPDPLVNIALYWTILQTPVSKTADVCSLINVSTSTFG